LYYLQSRYYNPDWGRFVNADDTDQLSKLGSNSDQLIDANLFAYCGNNPVNGEDQDGHWWGFIAEIGFIAALPEEVVAVAAVAVAVVVIAVVVVTSCVHAAIQEYRNSHVVYSSGSSNNGETVKKKERSQGRIGYRVNTNSKKEAYQRAKKAGKGAEPIHHTNHGRSHYHPNVAPGIPKTRKQPYSHDHYFY
jgi:RHS repeat-associated protein